MGGGTWDTQDVLPFLLSPKSKQAHNQHSQLPITVPVFPKAKENPWLLTDPWKNRFLQIPQDSRAPDLTDQRTCWKGVRACTGKSAHPPHSPNHSLFVQFRGPELTERQAPATSASSNTQLTNLSASPAHAAERTHPRSPFPPGILTAELLEVGLQLLPGAEEDPALLGAHHEGALVVHGDAGHLGVQLGERGALRRAGAVPRVSHPHPSSIIFLCWPKYHGVYGACYAINTLATLRPHKGTWLRYAKSSWFGLQAFCLYFSSPKSNHSIVFLQKKTSLLKKQTQQLVFFHQP